MVSSLYGIIVYGSIIVWYHLVVSCLLHSSFLSASSHTIYSPGNACLVILPDPAACGFNIVGATTTDNNTQQQAAAAASGGVSGGGITSSNGGDSSSTSGGAGCAVVAQPAAVTVTTVPRTFGTTGTGGTCKSDNDCLQNLLCISRNGGLCA